LIFGDRTAMSGIAYFFKPKITGGDSSSATTEKRPGRRSKASKSAETADKTAPPPPASVQETIPETVPESSTTAERSPEIGPPPEPEHQPEPVPETQPEPQPETQPEPQPEPPPEPQPEPQPESQPQSELKPVIVTTEEQSTENVPSPTPTPKIKLKFNLRSQSVQDTSDDRVLPQITASHLSENDDEESSDGETRLKIDDHDVNLDEAEIPMPEPIPMTIVSPTKKKSSSSSSSRKKVISHLIGTSSNTLTIDEPSPIKLVPNEAHFSEVKQTKSGRTIKYTPYFKELVQGASISPPSSPSHSTTPAKRPSNYSKKKQSSIKADLDAIKNASLSISIPTKGKKGAGASPKAKKQPAASPVKRLGQGKKSATPKATSSNAKSKRVVNEPAVEETMESDDDNDVAPVRSDDEEFRQDEQSDEGEDDELDAEEDDDDQSAGGMASDEEEWTSNGTKFDSDRSLSLASTLGSISSEMLDGYSLWAMKYRARHRSISLDDKQLYRTWKKMSAHDRQRWCLKAEKENFHYPITAAFLKSTTNNTTNETSSSSVAAAGATTTKSTKTPKRKKGTDDPPPILLQKTLNQYSKTQPSFTTTAARTSTTLVKQSTTSTVNTTPKNYDVLDIAAGIYLLGDSLTKMGEKVRQLGHLNPRGASAATSIDSLTAILFDGTLCACNLMACLGNEIVSTNPTTNRSDPLTNKLMENLGILLPGLN